MKRNHLQKRDDVFPVTMPDIHPVQKMFRQMFAEIENFMRLPGVHGLFDKFPNQVKIEETSDAYKVVVMNDSMGDPNDIEAHYANGHLHLRRTVQLETQRDLDQGTVRQSYHEYFARTIPIDGSISWKDREIQAGKGYWSIRLPKK
ncbi:hypothetical protein [Effusibacillus consociatus]|uniref:SHSP domain-containing protein n=1 Tax=Effusibacillus consociatus TaxID=1117041 RepID=A0ABV9PW63_9BACL